MKSIRAVPLEGAAKLMQGYSAGKTAESAQAMQRALAERIQRLALRQGANYMLKAVRQAAPKKTGRLRKAIKIRNSKINRLQKNGNVGVFLTVYPGKSRKDQAGAWYGKFVEVGYRRGSKAITGAQAVAAGILTREEYRLKRAGLRAKRKGRYAQGVRIRHGGNSVDGLHFVRNTFEQTKEQAARIIVEASQVAVARVVQEL